MSGVCDLTTPDEVGSLRTALRLLSYLPDNNRSLSPFVETSDSIDRFTVEEDILFRKTFDSPAGMNAPLDITLFLQQICDHGEYFELQPARARNMITAFGRIAGHVIGFVANNSAVASGQIDVDAARKATRFIRFCNLYNIPLIFLEDTTGFLPGTEQEGRGIVLEGRRLLDAIIDVRVPSLTLIIRNAFGGAYAAYNSHFVGADMVFAMPHARIAVMGKGPGTDFVFKDEIRALDAEYKKAVAGGTDAAEAARTRDAGVTQLQDRYERELMNPEGGALPRFRHGPRHPGDQSARPGREPEFLDAYLPARAHARSAAGVRVVLDREFTPGRFHESSSPWVRSFALDDLKVLVVCRGPVRQEAFEIFDAMGIREYGMLLSEKDSVVYPRCLAPELRSFRFPLAVHRVRDYMGVGQEEKLERIREIVAIAVEHQYTHVFAGYGFMAEDASFVQAIEDAGIGFLGPCAEVIRRAGAKDEAKKLARELGNSVIPGVDDISSRALLARVGDRAGLEALAAEHGLTPDFRGDSPSEDAEALLQAGYAKTLELVTIAELQEAAGAVCAEIWGDYPTHRIRFKHIGGGGGKGQRVVREPGEVEAAVMDVLAESKVVEPGSNRNFLVELNIESTRHNEIQLIGNGEWSVSLGGRDCSVQMHEQKLIEVSLTQELLDVEVERADGKAREILRGDKETLARMETEAERFGEATGLDSVSTFECIVEGFNHFFMEMNTRIQVEHGVTELAYRLKFTNPDNASECFYVDELIEAMALLAKHGSRVPKPERVTRSVSGLEVRINATNAALQPHAGGVIKSWSAPIDGEIRFDQGIGQRNPDTGIFVWYNLAGAYDSNVALLLTDGATRQENYERMAEVLRRTELRGDDLQTNLPVHYGLIQWFLGRGVMAEPTTRFMSAYLAAVGSLQQVISDVDVAAAVAETGRRAPDAEAAPLLAAKQTLLQRPIERLLENAHVFGGFLGRYDGELWRVENDAPVFVANPLRFLERLHHFLDLEDREEKPPAEKLWAHDAALLRDGLAFYAEVERRTGARSQAELDSLFGSGGSDALTGGDATLWERCVAAHRGHQLGLELLLLIPRIGLRAGFLDISVDQELQLVFPPQFTDAGGAEKLARALAPPPPASSDEIVTPMGGTFYAREAPHLPLLIEEGMHFEAGQPLFIIEVMKMFNKVLAPFSGTVVENLMHEGDATVVKKGQPIFRIEPDERIEPESPDAIASRVRETTLELLG